MAWQILLLSVFLWILFALNQRNPVVPPHYTIFAQCCYNLHVQSMLLKNIKYTKNQTEDSKREHHWFPVFCYLSKNPSCKILSRISWEHGDDFLCENLPRVIVLINKMYCRAGESDTKWQKGQVSLYERVRGLRRVLRTLLQKLSLLCAPSCRSNLFLRKLEEGTDGYWEWILGRLGQARPVWVSNTQLGEQSQPRIA